jgi:hypothetical protein
MNQSYLWETPSRILDPAFTGFYADNMFLVDSILVIGAVIMGFALASIWYAPHYTYNLFVASSFFMSVGMIMAFVSKGPAVLFMLLMLYSTYKAVQEDLRRKEGYCHAE